MGGNQSKAYAESDFTFKQSYEIMVKNETNINAFMEQNGVVEAISKVQKIKINGNKNSTINIEALSTAELKTAQEIAGALEQLSDPEMSGLVALDVMNAIKNQNTQDISAQVASKSESTVITKTNFDINNCIEVCNQLNMCVDLASDLVARANSVIEDVEIEANADCNINLKAVSTAKLVATQLASFINKAASEIKQESGLDAKFMNNMEQSNEQTQEMLKNLANQMTDLGKEIAKQAGETARSWGDGLFDTISSSKWIILGPILAIIAIIALIIVFKLVNGGNKNQQPMNYQQMQYNPYQFQQPMMQQPMNYQQMQYNQQMMQQPNQQMMQQYNPYQQPQPNQQPMNYQPQMNEPQIEEQYEEQE